MNLFIHQSSLCICLGLPLLACSKSLSTACGSESISSISCHKSTSITSTHSLSFASVICWKTTDYWFCWLFLFPPLSGFYLFSPSFFWSSPSSSLALSSALGSSNSLTKDRGKHSHNNFNTKVISMK